MQWWIQEEKEREAPVQQDGGASLLFSQVFSPKTAWKKLDSREGMHHPCPLDPPMQWYLGLEIYLEITQFEFQFRKVLIF